MDTPNAAGEYEREAQREALRAYIAEMVGHRLIPETQRDVLVQLLLMPRIRGRFRALAAADIKAVAEEFVTRDLLTRKPRSRSRRTA